MIRTLGVLPVFPVVSVRLCEGPEAVREGCHKGLGQARLLKCGDYFVYPSEKLMSELPDDVSSVPENRAYLKVTNCRDARPHVPTDQERTGTPPGRQERAKQWRQAVTNCKSYLSPVVLDWDGPVG